MKLLIQRVISAKVEVGGSVTGEIGRGLLILFGAGQGDTPEDCVRLASKVSRLRIFEDENGKTNLSIKDVGGKILSVSQFTLLADCSHGNRPSFTLAAEPGLAKSLYERFNSELEGLGLTVRTGVFGARMELSLVNDGPFTVSLE